jgi:predicted NAD/FAD-binding protein
MKVAVVGAGIAGLTAAHHLSAAHDVTVFEADARAGGHTHTVPVTLNGQAYAVDTGFVVFEPATYPGFTRLLHELGVATQPAEMSFSVRSRDAGIEYAGRSWAALLAQPTNLVRPAFHRLLRDVVRFNREAAETADARPIDAYLAAHGYARELADLYLVPMVAAIWSLRPADVRAMPADYVVRFFHHHGLLRVAGQPQWRTITGGASRYVDALTARLPNPVRLGRSIASVRRRDDGVEVAPAGGAVERFDRVVLAVHGSHALRVLADPTPDERDVLGAFTEQTNAAVLHTDASVLPRARRAWSSWNAHLGASDEPVAVTYDMSRLQRLPSPTPICVTLNADVDPARILARFAYDHPIPTRASIAAQARHAVIDGVRRTHVCGAYWGWGFHEDGVQSALAVCRALGVTP